MESIRPATGARNVYVGTHVEVAFNGCIRRSSRHDAIQLLRGTDPVAGRIELAVDGRTLVFTPDQPLAYGTRYNVIVHDTVEGLFGERLEIPFLSDFRTQSSPDETPPTTTIDPPGGIFNTPVTVTLTCRDDSDGTGCAGTWYTLDGTTPNQASLVYDGPFTLEASATVAFFSVDYEGNAEDPGSAEFVIDTVPPSVVSVSPAAGADGVPRTASIVAQFDEALDPDLLNEDSLTVSGVTLRDWSYDEETFALTVVPHQRLRCGRTYLARVAGSVEDLAGNSMGDDHTWSFTATEDCLPPSTEADVPTGLYEEPFAVTLSCTTATGGACARIVYTTDGNTPEGSPPEETIVAGATAGPIPISEGHTVVRFFGEDTAGNREPIRERRYTVTNSGITWVNANGLRWGVGPMPDRFVRLESDGNTVSFAHDPVTGRLYRSAAYGLRASDDGGETWVRVEGVFAPGAIYARGSQIYVASSHRLLISDDGGTSFRSTDLGERVNDIAGVGVGEAVFFGTRDGLWRTTDDGQTFERLGEEAGIGWVRDLAVAGDTLLVGTPDGLWLSVDGGQVLVRRDETHGLPDADLLDLTVDGTQVYVGTDGGLAYSDDGDTFTPLELVGAQATYERVIHVVASGDTIFAYATQPSSTLLRSTDGGENFVEIPFHPDWNISVRRFFLHEDRLWVGATPGYHVSDDGGDTFEVHGPVGSTSLRAAGPGHVYATTSQDGLAQSLDGGITWRMITRTDGLDGNSSSDVFVDGDRVYAITSTSLSISEDGGRTFGSVSRFDEGGPSSNLSCVVADGGRVWGAGSNLDVSEDGGWTFTQRYSNVGGCHRMHVDGDRIVIANRDGLAISEDGGVSFSVTPIPSDDSWPPWADDLAIDGSGRIWVVGDRLLFVSRDAGATLEPVDLDETIETVRAYGDLVMVGTWGGLAISSNGGESFVMREVATLSSVTQVAYVANP